ncbi:hypothetical protein [Roseovarius albus]|uniref:hypothetical protein n=1 Tax=Roseovarius albus TaxID=1247867 RepID=UPI001179C3C7|nr:hypothetical protein [Roseovarius albus]
MENYADDPSVDEVYLHQPVNYLLKASGRIEKLADLTPVRKLSNIPLDQLNVFLKLINLLAKQPELVFHKSGWR